MLSRIFALFCILQSLPAIAQSVADQLPNARLIINRDVLVKNPKGVFIRTQATSGKTFQFDDKCGMVEGGVLIPVAEKDGKVLVKYSSTRTVVISSECPNGTLTFFTLDSYKTMKSVRREGYTVAQEMEMEEVERLLANSKK